MVGSEIGQGSGPPGSIVGISDTGRDGILKQGVGLFGVVHPVMGQAKPSQRLRLLSRTYSYLLRCLQSFQSEMVLALP